MPETAPADPITIALNRLVSLVEAGNAEGLDRTAAAAFIGVSIRKFDELNSMGLLPEAASLGLQNCPRWSRSILRAWLASGAPCRAKWREIQDQTLRKLGAR